MARGLFTAASAVLITACVQEPVEPVDAMGPSLGGESNAAQRPETVDDLFLRIGEAVPAFAGMFMGGDTVIVRVTTMSDSSSAIKAARDIGVLGGTGPMSRGVVEGSVRFEPARFSFAQLYAFADLLTLSGALNEAIYLDVDEVKNALRIGLPDDNRAARLREAARAANVPDEAVVTEMRRVVPAVSLRDRIRPVSGGLQVQAEDEGSCSLGVNANALGVAGFITASHCTLAPFGFDGGSHYQNVVGGNNEIGWELLDPGPLYPPGAQPCYAELSSIGCRYSDAAFVLYTGSQGSQGTIARTTGIGSTSIDANRPRFLISGASWVPPFVGDQVNRIGRSTGWRAGHVTATCVHYYNFFVAGFGLLCQTESDAIANEGDSGGPVFAWDGYGDYVEVVGITVALLLNPQTGRIVGSSLSPWLFVEFELGPLDVTY